MSTYVVLYKFTADGVKNIRDSVKRAGQVRQQNAAAGFKILEVFWTQGPYDMVAIVDAPTGSLVSYSTAPGTEAQDGDGNNSPFTAALLKVGQEPGLPIGKP